MGSKVKYVLWRVAMYLHGEVGWDGGQRESKDLRMAMWAT